MTSSLLIIIDEKESATEASNYLHEAIDAAMGVAAFGVRTSILFRGESIGFAVGEKKLKIIDALEYYDIEKMYIFESDLEQYFKDCPALNDHIHRLKDNNLSSLLEQHSQILRMG